MAKVTYQDFSGRRKAWQQEYKAGGRWLFSSDVFAIGLIITALLSAPVLGFIFFGLAVATALMDIRKHWNADLAVFNEDVPGKENVNLWTKAKHFSGLLVAKHNRLNLAKTVTHLLVLGTVMASMFVMTGGVPFLVLMGLAALSICLRVVVGKMELSDKSDKFSSAHRFASIAHRIATVSGFALAKHGESKSIKAGHLDMRECYEIGTLDPDHQYALVLQYDDSAPNQLTVPVAVADNKRPFDEERGACKAQPDQAGWHVVDANADSKLYGRPHTEGTIKPFCRLFSRDHKTESDDHFLVQKLDGKIIAEDETFRLYEAAPSA